MLRVAVAGGRCQYTYGTDVIPCVSTMMVTHEEVRVWIFRLSLMLDARAVQQPILWWRASPTWVRPCSWLTATRTLLVQSHTAAVGKLCVELGLRHHPQQAHGMATRGTILSRLTLSLCFSNLAPRNGLPPLSLADRVVVLVVGTQARGKKFKIRPSPPPRATYPRRARPQGATLCFSPFSFAARSNECSCFGDVIRPAGAGGYSSRSRFQVLKLDGFQQD
ncbi:hypothetical protein CONLIGDRAFT_436815 [Coniochaeta ligniaria NRRL 30616]|uniref:Uncharacterized protein n=1 Tax=Coniochaeta ligniaria NRRL 30616 TaxID=1408157 RepID=A0A1J7IJ64_9PEZI|nr:hypothetical protein CONLIGDRAFT_436815 [Coniochaeta ligniaria NRRL 30616]